MKVHHDAMDLLGRTFAEGRKDLLARLTLSIGQMQDIADPPPAQAQGPSEPQIAMSKEIAGKEGARLTTDDRAIVVKGCDPSPLVAGHPIARRLVLAHVLPLSVCPYPNIV